MLAILSNFSTDFSYFHLIVSAFLITPCKNCANGSDVRVGRSLIRCKCTKLRVLHISSGGKEDEATKTRRLKAEKNEKPPSLVVTNAASFRRKSARAVFAAARCRIAVQPQNRSNTCTETRSTPSFSYSKTSTRPQSSHSVGSNGSSVSTTSPRQPQKPVSLDTVSRGGLERLRLKTFHFDGPGVFSKAGLEKTRETPRSVTSVPERQRCSIKRYNLNVSTTVTSSVTQQWRDRDAPEQSAAVPKVVYGQPWLTSHAIEDTGRPTFKVLQMKAASFPKVPSYSKQLPRATSHLADHNFYTHSLHKSRVGVY